MPRPPAQLRRRPLPGGAPDPFGQRARRGTAEGGRAGGAESLAPAFPPAPFATKRRGWVVPAGRMRPPARKGGQATRSSLRGPPAAPRSLRLHLRPRADQAAPGPRATGGMLGCSFRPQVAPPRSGTHRRASLTPGQLGMLIRASDKGRLEGGEEDGPGMREGKLPKRGERGAEPELTPGRMPQHFLYYAFPAQGKLIPPLRASIRHLFDTHDA